MERPSLASTGPSKDRGRRESRMHVAPAASCARQKVESTRVNTGTPKHSGLPCAMVLRLIARSPRSAGLDSLRRLPNIFGKLDPSVGGPGPHAFAVRRPHPSSDDAVRVHRLPPDVRDDAYAPPIRAGRRQSYISEKRKSNFHRRRGDHPDRLEAAREIDFSARAILRGDAQASAINPPKPSN
jgi:hypothetical protein